MTEQFFTRDSIPASPWKNGGGVTREIARSPQDAAFWRVSIAQVDAEGPFSIFAGLDRILTVIDGTGMVLARKQGNLRAGLFEPVRFSGSDAVTGLLPDGPVQDFNVVFDAARLDARVRVLHRPDSDANAAKDPVLTLVFCLQGAFERRGSDRLLPMQGVLDPTSPVTPTHDAARALFLEISPKLP